jgi:hypothetical protein
MRPGLRLAVALVIALGAPGCVQRDGRNSDCRWPAEASNHSADARRLSADAEFAEDLAIRYADTHFGRHNSTLEKGVERDRCLGKLFEEVAEEHGVRVEQVSSSLGRNRAYIDIAESLPFALLYGLAAVAIARMNWRRYSPDEHGWTIGITMASFLSLVLAAGSTMLGELWIWTAEGFRIGNEHMSYRSNRLFWARHRFELFAGAFMIFWLAAINAARRLCSERSSGG